MSENSIGIKFLLIPPGEFLMGSTPEEIETAGGDDDKELLSKDYTTGKDAWAVYNSSTEPLITALGNTVRFAYSAVSATNGGGPEMTEGNSLDSAYFGVVPSTR